MKKIKLPKHEIYSFSDINISPEKITYKIKKEELDTVRKNAMEIISFTITIERELERLLISYFYPENNIIDVRRDFFKHEVLEATHLNFNNKKNLVIKIINNLSLLESTEKNDISNGLKKIGDYRNSFAHGEIIQDFSLGVILKYYSNGHKEDILDDEYWEKVEKTSKKVYDLLHRALLALKDINKKDV